MSKKRSALWCTLIVAFLFEVSNATAQDSKVTSVRQALLLIQGDGWDRVRKAWGPSGVERINASMPQAAERIANSSECDRLESVGLSEQRSSAPKVIIFYADCVNGKRFYIDERHLKQLNPSSVQSKTSRVPPDALVLECESRVKSQLNNPMTFTRRFGTTTVQRASTGNLVVQFDFTAKNGFGAELPSRARCVADDRGMQNAEVLKF